LNKTTRPILAGKINSSSSLVNELANITSSLKPTITAAVATTTASDKNNNTNGKNSKTNQDIDKIKSIIKLEEKFKKNIDLFQKEINSCQHLEAISMEFISNEKQQQQPSSSTKITKTKTSTNNSTKTTTTTTTTITKNASVIDSKTTTVSNNKNIKGANVEKVIQMDESTSGKKLRSSSSSSSSMANVINNAKISTTSSPVKILKELAKSKDKKYSEVKRMIEDEKLAKELAIKLKEQDSDDYEDDDDCEHESDEEDEDEDSDEEEDEEDSDDDDEDDDGEYSQEFQNMSYNDHLITIIMKPPKGSGNQSLENKMNSIHRNALKGKAINVATAAATQSSTKASSLTSSVKCKDRDKAISLAANEEERIESTLSALSLHGHLNNRKPSVEEILKTINSNDENIIFVQPFSENNGNASKSTDSTTTASANQQQRKTYRRKPVMQCTNVHCISSGNGNCHANTSTSGLGGTTTTTTTTSTTTSRNKDVLIESNTVIRLNSSPTRSGIVDLRDEKNASQLAFLLNLKNESQKSSSVYNRLKAQAAKPLQKLNSNSSETSNKNSAKMTGTIMKGKSFFVHILGDNLRN